MRATLMYGAGDVRVETVPDASLKEPTDAVVRVTQACICGSDSGRRLDAAPPGRPTDGPRVHRGHRDIGRDVSGFTRGDVVVAPFVWAEQHLRLLRRGTAERRSGAAARWARGSGRGAG